MADYPADVSRSYSWHLHREILALILCNQPMPRICFRRRLSADEPGYIDSFDFRLRATRFTPHGKRHLSHCRLFDVNNGGSGANHYGEMRNTKPDTGE